MENLQLSEIHEQTSINKLLQLILLEQHSFKLLLLHAVHAERAR